MLLHCLIVSSGPVTATQFREVYICIKLQAFKILLFEAKLQLNGTSF